MNLGDIKQLTLMLMNEYSIDGEVKSDDENASYLLRVPSLATLAQNEIANLQPVISTHVLAGEGTAYGEFFLFDLPSDCLGIQKVEAIYRDRVDKSPRGYIIYHSSIGIIDKNKTWTLYYRKQPADLVDDDDELEVSRDGQDAIPFYCASKLLLDEDETISKKLQDEYYSRLARLSQKRPNRVRNGMGW